MDGNPSDNLDWASASVAPLEEGLYQLQVPLNPGMRLTDRQATHVVEHLRYTVNAVFPAGAARVHCDTGVVYVSSKTLLRVDAAGLRRSIARAFDSAIPELNTKIEAEDEAIREWLGGFTAE